MADSRDSFASDNTFLTVLALAVAAVVQIAATSGPFSAWHVMTGSVILFILAGYRVTAALRVSELLALATTWGLTILLTVGVALEWLFPSVPRQGDGEIPGYFVFSWWLVFSSIAALVGFLRRRSLRLRASDAEGAV